MAVRDIKDAQGFTENTVQEIGGPGAERQPSVSVGVPPPASADVAPQVSTVVPGEVLQTDTARLQPSSADGEALTNVISELANAFSQITSDESTDVGLVSADNTAVPDGGSGKPPSFFMQQAPEAWMSSKGSFSDITPSRPAAVKEGSIWNKMLRNTSSGARDTDGGTPMSSDPAVATGASINAATTTASKGGSPLEIAQAFLGHDERNPEQAKALAAFFKEAGGVNADPATTAWCAAFVNAVLGRAGMGGTGKLNAQSFLNYGTPVDEPQVGDIVVFERGKKGSWQGHVGLVAGVGDDGKLQVLGGNQSTQESRGRGVTVSINSFGTDRVLGYRRPTAPNQG
jgi:uncharacterized protein (TIGR02594 family)